ncbi:LuxR C-terminal-related transcriptional regulator [Streptomyces sp. SP18CS02]|uniref:LuxR C-terminal-related transcriptional regulator n=1 Tax=Streptomyces sp. SP18CS02 TaxID=3002531 RepID=UPI002E7970B2|nr:LuxR C-terminal-related transcriptional regulator [Streptomyces sp. SP18CS02]MEE1753163.1 LuxR C-terminal-related transcriptional regulator [Streptomyces sp. SP18CS02]
MTFIVELIFREGAGDRPGGREEHRAYWNGRAREGVLIGGGPWRDGPGELLLCEAPDRAFLLRVVHADPSVASGDVVRLRIREWNVVMGDFGPPARAHLTGGREPARAWPPLAAAGGTGGLPVGQPAREPATRRRADEAAERRGPAGAGAGSGTGCAELTAHEERIAAMMVDGMTNRAIAQALSVSTRAVELHITRIYLKLSIRRRAQLAPALSRRREVV